MDTDVVNTGFGPGNHIHPILLPHVADKIMKYLPREGQELQKVRLVCKQWAKSASLVLRNQNEIRVGHYCTDVPKFAEVLELARTSDCFPVTRFTFCQDIFHVENEQVLKNFFEVFGQILEVITLWFDLKSTFVFNQDCFISSPEFRELKLPRLKSLGLDDRRTINHTFDETGPVFIKWLVQASPNLEELIIQYDREFETNGLEKGGHVNQMLSSLFLENQTSLRYLKDLKFDVHINDDLLECLNSFCQTSRLNSLHLCLRKSSFSQDAFSSLLSTLTYSLKELRLTFLSTDSDFTIQFPRMENLSLLEVSGWDMKYQTVFFGSFSYSIHLPRLKTLILNSWTGKADWWQFVYCKTPVLTLEELKLPEEVTTVDNMKDIVKMFPNLKKLELKVSTSQIRVLESVFEHLTGLTHLKIIKSPSYFQRSVEKMDSVLTGISQQGCEKMLQSNCLDDLLPMITDLQNFRQRPGLTNLKNLRRLEIKDDLALTDITGYLAFMCMESLEYLDTGRSGMSDGCMKRLAIKFPNNMAAKSHNGSFKSETFQTGEEDPSLEFPGRCVFL